MGPRWTPFSLYIRAQRPPHKSHWEPNPGATYGPQVPNAEAAKRLKEVTDSHKREMLSGEAKNYPDNSFQHVMFSLDKCASTDTTTISHQQRVI